MNDLETELGRLDPAREWEPWKPTDKDPWGLKWAGHLYRRAAFGGSWPELQAAVKAGPDAAVGKLLAGGPGWAEFDKILDAVAPEPSTNPRRAPEEPEAATLEGWWLHRIAFTPHPLRERMTLFWHNHFATSIEKVRSAPLMRDQNVLLREHALGRFGTLAQEIGKDPAMLVWLDSNSNVKGAPNENYARELMELFCLGVGNYTEKDVREAARAFTGWHTTSRPEPGDRTRTKPVFVFQPALHDDGEKTVLRKAGQWDGSAVVRIVLEQPACARFVVRKLYREFVSEAAVPPDELLAPLAEQFRKSDYDVAAVLKVMLRSRHFYSRFAYRQRVRGPVEFVVALARATEGKLAPGGRPEALAAAVRGLGQTLFAPPSVKGWDGGKTWLNTATVVGRNNAAWRLIQESGVTGVRVNPTALLARHAANRDATGQAAFFLDLLLQPEADEIDGRAAKLLADHLAVGKPEGIALERRFREVLHAIACMPITHLA
jgi:uncharacterized protein (DUF1800 family)